MFYRFLSKRFGFWDGGGLLWRFWIGIVVKMVAMDLFRSEEMSLVQLIIPAESAHDTVTYLAELGLIQFKDVRICPLPVCL